MPSFFSRVRIRFCCVSKMFITKNLKRFGFVALAPAEASPQYISIICLKASRSSFLSAFLKKPFCMIKQFCPFANSGSFWCEWCETERNCVPRGSYEVGLGGLRLGCRHSRVSRFFLQTQRAATLEHCEKSNLTIDHPLLLMLEFSFS